MRLTMSLIELPTFKKMETLQRFAKIQKLLGGIKMHHPTRAKPKCCIVKPRDLGRRLLHFSDQILVYLLSHAEG